MKHTHFRYGFTLIEVLLLLGVFSLVIVVMIPLLTSGTEARIRQQTVAVVEYSGLQAVQSMQRRVHNAEKILLPAAGATGPVLAVQSASGQLHPTMFAVQTGSLVIIEGNEVRKVTPELVAVKDFTVRNTSQSTANQSAYVTFTV